MRWCSLLNMGRKGQNKKQYLNLWLSNRGECWNHLYRRVAEETFETSRWSGEEEGKFHVHVNLAISGEIFSRHLDITSKSQERQQCQKYVSPV